MITLVLLALAQVTTPSSMNLNGQAPTRFACDGGITCTRSGSTLTITGTTGGGAPSVTCAADEALTWNGAAYSCISKVRAAFMADAGITAQTATQLASDPTACSAGQYVTDISAAGALTCSTPPGTGVTSVSGSTFVSSSGGTTPAVSLSATGTPSATTYLRGDNTWATPSGSGSGPNVGQFTVSFGNGTVATNDGTATVTAAWVTNTSSIVLTPACWVYDGGVGPTPDECAIALPKCSVVGVTASTSFNVRCYSETGGFGTYFINYSGI